MATIERRPLPPPGYSATTITEADRAKIMGQANDVIDHYLNGSGSFTIDGIRKPLSDEPGYDSTVQDLTNFKDSIINAQQFADDPSRVLNSVVGLINRTIHQLQHAAVAGNVGVTDNNTLPAPATPDSINSAHVPIPLGPTDLSRSAPGGELLGPFGINERFSPGSATPSQTLYETRSFAVPSQTNPGAGVVPVRSSSASNPSGSFNDRFGNWASPQANPIQNDPQQTRVLRGYVVGQDGSRLPLAGPEQAPQRQDQPMTGYGLPSILGLSDQSASGDDMDDWLARWMPLFRQ